MKVNSFQFFSDININLLSFCYINMKAAALCATRSYNYAGDCIRLTDTKTTVRLKLNISKLKSKSQN